MNIWLQLEKIINLECLLDAFTLRFEQQKIQIKAKKLARDEQNGSYIHLIECMHLDFSRTIQINNSYQGRVDSKSYIHIWWIIYRLILVYISNQYIGEKGVNTSSFLRHQDVLRFCYYISRWFVKHASCTCDSESWTTAKSDEISAQKFTSWELDSNKYALKFLNTSPEENHLRHAFFFVLDSPLSRLCEPAWQRDRRRQRDSHLDADRQCFGWGFFFFLLNWVSR